ncbi:hypothetical protein FQN50_002502 [Emmonsiellopsis sp. PD_5]|nr:hypothetical protein FQN50_002502 [Emmonsiellopsis sp. PD_5]
MSMQSEDTYGTADDTSGMHYAFETNQEHPFRNFPTKVEIPPCGLLKGILFLSPSTYRERVSGNLYPRLNVGMAWTNRFLTQPETDAFVDNAVYIATAIRVGQIIGFVAGIRYCVPAARAFMRNGKLLPSDELKRVNRKPLFFRAFVFTPVFMLFGTSVGASVGSMHTATRANKDPRLSQFMKDRAKIVTPEVEERYRRLKVVMQKPLPPLNSDFEPAEPTPKTFARLVDYANFVSGDYKPRDYQPGRMTQALSERQQTLSEMGQKQQTPPYQPPGRQLPQPGDQQDNSPTANNATEDFLAGANPDSPTTTLSSTTQPSQESAWNRLRKSIPSPSSQPATTRESDANYDHQPTSSTPGSTWDRLRTSSPQRQAEQWPQQQSQQEDDLTSGSKEQAQREFDLLLEKERHVGSDGEGTGFNSTGGGGKKW